MNQKKKVKQNVNNSSNSEDLPNYMSAMFYYLLMHSGKPHTVAYTQQNMQFSW